MKNAVYGCLIFGIDRAALGGERKGDQMPELNNQPIESAAPDEKENVASPETEATATEEAPAAPGLTPEEEQEVLTHSKYLEMALGSGVLPMETRYSQINHPYRKVPIAYRSFTYLNSIVSGVVPPEKYSYASDATELGVRLSRFNIISAMRAVRKMESAGRKIEFITARLRRHNVASGAVRRYQIFCVLEFAPVL